MHRVGRIVINQKKYVASVISLGFKNVDIVLLDDVIFKFLQIFVILIMGMRYCFIYFPSAESI